MKKFLNILLIVVLVSSLGINLYQYKRFVNTYNDWANSYIDIFTRTLQSVKEIQSTKEKSQQNLHAYALWYEPQRLTDLGNFLDSMLQRPQMSVLARLGLELQYFSMDVWDKNGLKQPTRSDNNSIPSLDDLAKLNEVYIIYRNHFTDSVIRSRNFEQQRQALIEANREIKSKGLDGLLKNPSSLDAGIQ